MFIPIISLNKFYMETNEYLLERCFIRYVVEKYYRGREPNYSEFAKLVFFDRGDPVTTFRNIRQGKPKPQRLNLEEAARMARLLGTDLASLFFHVQKEVENGWSLEDDFKSDEASPGPKKKGRKSKALSVSELEEKNSRKFGNALPPYSCRNQTP